MEIYSILNNFLQFQTSEEYDTPLVDHLPKNFLCIWSFFLILKKKQDSSKMLQITYIIIYIIIYVYIHMYIYVYYICLYIFMYTVYIYIYNYIYTYIIKYHCLPEATVIFKTVKYPIIFKAGK